MASSGDKSMRTSLQEVSGAVRPTVPVRGAGPLRSTTPPPELAVFETLSEMAPLDPLPLVYAPPSEPDESDLAPRHDGIEPGEWSRALEALDHEVPRHSIAIGKLDAATDESTTSLYEVLSGEAAAGEASAADVETREVPTAGEVMHEAADHEPDAVALADDESPEVLADGEIPEVLADDETPEALADGAAGAGDEAAQPAAAQPAADETTRLLTMRESAAPLPQFDLRDEPTRPVLETREDDEDDPAEAMPHLDPADLANWPQFADDSPTPLVVRLDDPPRSFEAHSLSPVPPPRRFDSAAAALAAHEHARRFDLESAPDSAPRSSPRTSVGVQRTVPMRMIEVRGGARSRSGPSSEEPSVRPMITSTGESSSRSPITMRTRPRPRVSVAWYLVGVLGISLGLVSWQLVTTTSDARQGGATAAAAPRDMQGPLAAAAIESPSSTPVVAQRASTASETTVASRVETTSPQSSAPAEAEEVLELSGEVPMARGAAPRPLNVSYTPPGQHAEQLGNIARMALIERDFQRARDVYARALAENPRYFPAALGRADAEWAMGDHEQAVEHYRALTERFPSSMVPLRAWRRSGIKPAE